MLLPLYEIIVPPNAALFFDSLMSVCAFDPIPTEELWHIWLQVEETGAISNNFALIGYESKLILVNLGSFTLFLIAFPLLYLISPILEPCKSNYRVEKLRLFIRGSLVWAGPLRIMKESYLIVIIPALININLLRFDSYGMALNSILCLAINSLMLLIPYWIYKFMKKKAW